jgi:hypothetical protein
MMLQTELIRPAAGDRVLTVRDPWAHLLIAGEKPIENRAWRTSHRGRIWIHAAVNFDYGDFDWCKDQGLTVPDPDDLPGGILGCVTLTNCLALEDLPRRAGRALVGRWAVLLAGRRSGALGRADRLSGAAGAVAVLRISTGRGGLLTG